MDTYNGYSTVEEMMELFNKPVLPIILTHIGSVEFAAEGK